MPNAAQEPLLGPAARATSDSTSSSPAASGSPREKSEAPRGVITF
jgi:hypothetical protein